MNFSELFIDKSKTLIINTELAVILGDLNESIVLNQLNYWLEINKKANKHFIDGRFWVYNTYNDWKEENFQYWSEKTIQRTFTRLENKGIVISANFNKSGIDKTKWYTIDYDKLEEIVNLYREEHDNLSQRQDNMSTRQDKMTCPSGQSDRAIPENTTNNTNRNYHSEITKKEKTLSNDNVEVKTSSSESRKKMSTPKTNLQKYIDKKADEQDMIKRLANICMTNYDDETAREIFETIEYYFRRYTDKTGLIHPILTDKTLERMAEKMDRFYDSKHSHFERLIKQDHAFKKMVDMFFDSDFGAVNGNETNYNLPAFMTDGILNPLGQRLFELGEVM